MFRHWIDRCTQHEVNGWSTAPEITVAVNDGRIARLAPDLARDDLAASGIEGGHGFTFHLPNPLWLDDELSLAGPDGSVLRQRLDPPVADRIRELTRYIDPAHQTGLELGPLDRPLIPKTRFRVWTMDQADHAELTARHGQSIVQASLAPPDFILGDRPMLEVTGGRRFAYAVASHVIEHVPDMVGWLWQVWSVLEDGGVLALAVPHAERIFDRHRRLSGIAELTEAFFGRFTQPSPRQIIDAMVGTAIFHGLDVEHETWKAFHLANHARKTGLYTDMHCNTFTPASFAGLLRCLDACELLGFQLLHVGARGDDDEFTAHLRKRADKVLPDHVSP